MFNFEDWVVDMERNYNTQLRIKKEKKISKVHSSQNIWN
jgi:hypothetical protein